MKPHAVLLHPTWDVNHPFVQGIRAIYGTYLLVTRCPSVPLGYQINCIQYHSACVPVTLICLLMAPKCNSSGAGN